MTWYTSIAIRHYDGALVLPDLAFLRHVAAPSLPALLSARYMSTPGNTNKMLM